MNLKNKVVIVSGGASGLGWATAQRLQVLGAYVVIIDINEAELKRCAEMEGIMTFCCDITDADQLEATIELIAKEYAIFDVCVNCAGIAPAARIVGREGPQPLEDFERVIKVNLIGTFNMMRVLACYMQEQDPDEKTGARGVIINTSSVAAYEGQIGQAAYSASKGA